MNEIQRLHQLAMEYAEEADLAKRQGDLGFAFDRLRKALEAEAAAARLATEENAPYEPTRSILHRSAATLALESGDIREAERLVATALAGDPPQEIAQELRDLLEQVNFERHLELRGITLSPEELQLTVAGSAVGFGIALSEVVIQRVTKLEALVYRTVERLQGRKYRDKGPVKKTISRPFSLYMSVARPGSFTVTLQLGRQAMLPGFGDTSQIIDEMIECLTLLNNAQQEELRNRITEEAYYRNFVSLAKLLAPDGDEVNLVGLTTVRNGSQRKLSFVRQQSDISLAPQEVAEQTQDGAKVETVTIRGVIRYADSLKRHEIRLVDDQDKTHRISVPEGLMNDIVRPLWDYEVIVTGLRTEERVIRLLDIQQVTE